MTTGVTIYDPHGSLIFVRFRLCGYMEFRFIVLLELFAAEDSAAELDIPIVHPTPNALRIAKRLPSLFVLPTCSNQVTLYLISYLVIVSLS